MPLCFVGRFTRRYVSTVGRECEGFTDEHDRPSATLKKKATSWPSSS